MVYFPITVQQFSRVYQSLSHVLLHVLDPTGIELSGFPLNIGGENGLDVWGSPAVSDLEGDGDIEIVIGSKNKHLFIVNSDGSVQVDYE